MKMKMKRTNKSSWGYFGLYPPVAVRLYARRKVACRRVVALSDEEIAMSSGLSLSKIRELSRMITWDDITMSDARLFCIGCNFDPTNSEDRNRAESYQRMGGTFAYLRRSPHWRQFDNLITIFRNAISQDGASPEAEVEARGVA